MIYLKSEREIELMRKASQMVAKVLQELKERVRPGTATMELNRYAEHRIKELGGKRVEGELIRTVFYSFLTSAAVLVIFYFTALRGIEGFIGKYGLFLLLAMLSYALISPAIRQVRAYQQFACMPGMMIGMTTGMISGFLPGFLVASTNGMFVGSIFGMAVGITLGIWAGKCCGVMGYMEGIMAGFMGGLMGAMTAFMLLTDHLKASAIIVFVISAVILVSLNYMIFGEMKENGRQIVEDHWITAIMTLLLMITTIWLMVFGPRSGIFS